MHWRKGLGIAAAFLVPFAVQAQTGAGANGSAGAGNAGGANGAYGAGGAGMNGGAAGGVQQIGGGAGTFAAGVINGTVENVNLSRGIVSLKTGAKTVTLNALPGEISQLNPGDVVALNYANFNGALWVQAANGRNIQQEALANVPFTNEGRVTGAIAQMGRAKGTITVRGSTFRIHPQQLQGFLPGQFVSVTYANVGGVNWVAAIAPARGAPSAGQASGAAGGPMNSGGGAGAGMNGGTGAGNAGNAGNGAGAGAGVGGHVGGAGAGANAGAGAGNNAGNR